MQGKLNMDAWVVTVKCGGDCHLTDITMAITKVMMMMVVLRIIKAIREAFIKKKKHFLIDIRQWCPPSRMSIRKCFFLLKASLTDEFY